MRRWFRIKDREVTMEDKPDGVRARLESGATSKGAVDRDHCLPQIRDIQA